MGSSFKLVKVFAIVAVILILITMGVFVYFNTDMFLKDASSKFESLNPSEFNTQWLSYEGKQAGSKLRPMAEKLISNANLYKKDATMLPDLIYKATEGDEPVYVRSTVKGKEKNNIEGFEQFKDSLNSRHTYWVEFVYSEKTNLISGIIVQYTQNDDIEFTPDET